MPPAIDAIWLYMLLLPIAYMLLIRAAAAAAALLMPAVATPAVYLIALIKRRADAATPLLRYHFSLRFTCHFDADACRDTRYAAADMSFVAAFAYCLTTKMRRVTMSPPLSFQRACCAPACGAAEALCYAMPRRRYMIYVTRRRLPLASADTLLRCVYATRCRCCHEYATMPRAT